MPDRLYREAPITAVDTATRTLTVQLLAWDEARTVTDPGRPPYRERWARDALVPFDRLYVVDRHGGELIGRMDTPYDAGIGPQAQVHIARTRAGTDLLELVDAGVIDAVSIEALPDPASEVWSPDHGEVTRTRGWLAGVAFAFTPAHDSPILARQGDTTVPTLTTEPDPVTPPEPTPAPPPPPPPPPPPESTLHRAGDLAVIQDEMAGLRAALAGLAGGNGAGTLPRFGSFGELRRAAATDPGSLRRDPMGGGVVVLQRAWTDVTTTDVPGLMPADRLRQLFDVIEVQQPLTELAGTLPGPTRLSYEYPRITQRPLVGPAAGEKVEIPSREIKIVDAVAPVVTLAGGNDVSIQVIQLSDPPYLEIAGQLYAEEMARATDAAAWLAYEAALPAGHEVSIGTDAAGWAQALFDLAALIVTNSRRFPNRIGLSVDLWAAIGGASDADGGRCSPPRHP